MKNLAIIPARSGSKGLKNKNIKCLNGKPLLAYAIEAANESELFDEIMVSTDSKEYAEIAVNSGAKVPFLRSNNNSDDNAGSWDVVLEVLKKYRDLGKYFDTVCLLQPTSPLRESKDIVDSYKLMAEKTADAITSVCEVDHSPLWTMVLPEDYSLTEFRNNLKNVPRQGLPKYYRLNGAIYIRKVSYFGSEIELSEKNEYAYVMERQRSIDIDTQDDFDFAEFYIDRLINYRDEKGNK